MHGEYRALCLEIVQSRADHVPNIFVEMKSKGLLDILTHRCARLWCLLLRAERVDTLLLCIQSRYTVIYAAADIVLFDDAGTRTLS